MRPIHWLLTLSILLPVSAAPAGAGEPLFSALEQELRLAGRFPQWHRILPAQPLTADQKRALSQAGAVVLEAAPPHGYLLQLPPDFQDPTGLLTPVPVHLEQKLSPALQRIVAGRDLPGGPLDIRALTLRGRSVAGPAASVRGLIAPQATFLAVQDASDRGHLWLRVQAEDLLQVLARLAAHPDILWIERQWPLEFKNDNSSWLIQSADESLGRTVWRHGLTGWGQVVGVADSGIDADGCQFRYSADANAKTPAIQWPQPPAADRSAPDNKVITYYVVGAADAYDDATGGYHGTHTVGDIAGDNYENLATADAAGHDAQDGMAPGAQIVFQDIGSDDGSLRGLQGMPMYDLLKQAYDTGVRVHNNSYGFSVLSVGYDSDSASIDQATWELNDLLVVFAAGNSGADDQGNLQAKSLGGTGSTSKNTLVVGASGPVELRMQGSTFRLENELLFFSSQGPTSDSRIKPDLVSPGMVFSASSDHGANLNLGCCDVYDRDKVASNFEDDNCTVDENYPTFGTSFSAPIAAGGATLVRQYFTDGFWKSGNADESAGFNPTNALVKGTLIAGAKPLTGGIVGMLGSQPLTQPPSYEQGWGRVHLENALYFEGDERRTVLLEDIPNPTPLNPMLDQAALTPWPDRAQPIITAEERVWHLPWSRSDGILKVVLTWSDPAAAPHSLIALVNNLDLEVDAPNGDFFLGNKEYDTLGYSQPSWRGQRDASNNVEVVTVREPQAGSHLVRVIAESVSGNGQEGSDAQGFSLLATGRFEPALPGTLDPDQVQPGQTIEQVQLTGLYFVPGMTLDLGPGVSVEGLEVIDGQTATIARITASDDAALGMRDGTLTVLRTLVGTGQGLLRVGGRSGGGCDCSTQTKHETGWWLASLFLFAWGVHRRRRT